MSTTTRCTPEMEIGVRFREARRRTLALCAPLTPEDMMVQSSPEASPAKWHLAHTAWFFESFILREFVPGYRLFNADFPWLFNSYYQSFAALPGEAAAGVVFAPRPGRDICATGSMWTRRSSGCWSAIPSRRRCRRIELGVNHEEQHQELLLTDILHAFFTNPLRPVYLSRKSDAEASVQQAKKRAPGASAAVFRQFEGGLQEVGHAGEGFCFDNERPRHRVWLEPYSLAQRLVTCGEFAEFMADGGYRRPEFWLSAGWDAVQQNGWRAPLYWTSESGDWSLFTLRGEQPLARMERRR